MKITTRLVLQHFLGKLSTQMEHSKHNELDPFFENFFLKDELTEILSWVYGDDAEMNQRIDILSPDDALEFISNRHILDYYRASWENEIERNLSITVDSVIDTLEQLGHSTHYLRTKAIDKWDEYDFSNYRSLSGKAGKVYTIYGIYDEAVHSKDASRVTSPPERFYETQKKAKQGIEESAFDPKEVKVLPLLVGDA